MRRIKLADRKLPPYTRAEEKFNMISHIAGGGIGLTALLTCVIVAAYNQNVWGVASGAVYGFSLILLFTMSSIYHGLSVGIPKIVFQIMDHCTIFVLIAGTYTPILLCGFRRRYPYDAWIIFGVVWGLAITGIVLNSIDLKRYKKMSMICYLGMGWICVFRLRRLIEVLGARFFAMLLIGGVFYTIGAVLYLAGRKKKYIHSVFHIFVDVAALVHFLGIAIYVMPG